MAHDEKHRASTVPPSATQPWICYAAFASFLPTVLATHAVSMPWRLVVLLAVPASIVVVLEALWERPAARPSTGLQPGQRWRPHWRAVAFKLVGLAAILGTIGLAQCVLSEYNKKLYRPWFGLLRAAGPWAAAAGVAYVVAADGYQTDEARAADRYHNLGRLLLGQGSVVTMPRGTCANLTREWLVKAYFTPLMLAFAQNSVAAWDEQTANLVDAWRRGEWSFGDVFSVGYEAIFFADVIWASFGYLLSFKMLDSHVRSAEPTFVGWMAALACYPPFVDTTIDAYLAYHGEAAWGDIFADNRVMYVLWGSAILVCSGVYLWATLVFGIRFSNLTNRGIITSGPYAITRHPAYVFKNISWWLIAVPWVTTHDSALDAARRCLRLAGVNGIYYLRARTEEAHLLQDPVYVDYYNAIQRRFGLSLLGEGSKGQQQQLQLQVWQEKQQAAAAAGGKGDGLLSTL